MRNYELMMVVLPHLDEESLAVTLGRVNRYIDERGGEVLQQQRWGNVRRLAYPIRSYTEGSYFLTHFQIDPQHTKELEADLIISEDVLRHLLVKVDGFEPTAEDRAPALAPAEEAPDTTELESSQAEEGTSPEAPVLEQEAASATEAPVATSEAEVAAEEEATGDVTETPVATAEAEVAVVDEATGDVTETPVATSEAEVAAVEEAPGAVEDAPVLNSEDAAVTVEDEAEQETQDQVTTVEGDVQESTQEGDTEADSEEGEAHQPEEEPKGTDKEDRG